MRIEPLKGWHRYTELMNAQSDPRCQAMLDNMRHHLKYECLCDPEIFNTMVPSPEYRFYASFDNAVLKGMDEVKSFYLEGKPRGVGDSPVRGGRLGCGLRRRVVPTGARRESGGRWQRRRP